MEAEHYIGNDTLITPRGSTICIIEYPDGSRFYCRSEATKDLVAYSHQVIMLQEQCIVSTRANIVLSKSLLEK